MFNPLSKIIVITYGYYNTKIEKKKKKMTFMLQFFSRVMRFILLDKIMDLYYTGLDFRERGICFMQRFSVKLIRFLVILILLVLVFTAFYVRAYAVRNRPFVMLTIPEHRSLVIPFEFYGIAEPSDDEQRERGFDWITIVTQYEELEIVRLNVGSSVGVHLIGAVVPIRGEVLYVYDKQDGIQYTIGFFGRHPGRDIEQGDGVKVSGEFRLDNQLMLLFFAVHFDYVTNDHFVYVVDRQDRTWGREFIARRVNIQLGISERREGHYIVLLDTDRPVILMSDGAIYDGARVRLFD